MDNGYSDFCNVKQLGLLLFLSGWDAIPSQMGMHLYILTLWSNRGSSQRKQPGPETRYLV